MKRLRGKSELEMHADDVPLSRLAELYDTPLYVYSGSTIRQRFQQFDDAFHGCEHTICYSVKANSNLSILRLLARLGAGFDIVSGGELQRVRRGRRQNQAEDRFFRSRQAGPRNRSCASRWHPALQCRERKRAGIAGGACDASSQVS